MWRVYEILLLFLLEMQYLVKRKKKSLSGRRNTGILNKEKLKI